MQVSRVWKKKKPTRKPKTPNRTRFPAKHRSSAELLPFLHLSEANFRNGNQAKVKNVHILLLHVWICNDKRYQNQNDCNCIHTKQLPPKCKERADTEIFPTTTHSYTQLTLKPSQQKGSCDQNTPLQSVSVIHTYNGSRTSQKDYTYKTRNWWQLSQCSE